MDKYNKNDYCYRFADNQSFYFCVTLAYLPLVFKHLNSLPYFISSPEHEVLMVSYCGQSIPSCVVRRAVSTIALKAYSSYTPGPFDLILGRKHQGDL